MSFSTSVLKLLVLAAIVAQGDNVNADAPEATEVAGSDALLGLRPKLGVLGEAAMAAPSVDLCGGSPVKVCDSAFDGASFGTDSGAVSGFSGLRLFRYKCTCKTCTTAAACASKCTRDNGAKEVFVYFEFRAGYCKNLNNNVVLTADTRSSYGEKIAALFLQHNTEKVAVVTATEELLKRSNARRSSKKKALLGEGAKTKTKVGGATDYTLPDGCALVSYSQLNGLMFVPNAAGASGFKYTSLHDYLKKTSTVGANPPNAYNLPADCIASFMPQAMWGYPQEEAKLADGRTGRTLLSYGGPTVASWMSGPYNALAKNINQMSFLTIQFREGLQGSQDGRAGRDKRNKYKGGLGMQVAICSDGSVKGVTALSAGKTFGDADANTKRCGGAATQTKIDGLLRETVAFARFQLAKKWGRHVSGWDIPNDTLRASLGRRRVLPYSHANSPCKATNWDGQRCLNEIMGEGPAGNTHMTSWKGAGPANGDGQSNTYCDKVGIGKQCFDVDLEKVAGRDDGLLSMAIGDSGFISAGGFMGIGGIRKNSGATDLMKKCSDGNTWAGKCTVKVCSGRLRIKHHPDLKLTVSWKTPLGPRVTKIVNDASWRRRSGPSGEWMMSARRRSYGQFPNGLDKETMYKWDGTEDLDTARSQAGNDQSDGRTYIGATYCGGSVCTPANQQKCSTVPGTFRV